MFVTLNTVKLKSCQSAGHGGESIIHWDAEQKSLVYSYFTTAGFTTNGPMSISEGVITTLEKVSGSKGVTEVRGTMALRPDGSMISKAEYIKDGKPAGGREVTYKEDAKAEVKWK